MKDIAIYRLQRVDKALERLNAAVTRLEAAAQTKGASLSGQSGNEQEALAAARADIAKLQGDYDVLHAAATKVAERLDGTIDRLKAETPPSAA